MNKKYLLYSTLITVLFGAIYYYVVLPPINLHSLLFYVSLILLISCFVLCNILFSGHPIRETKNAKWVIVVVSAILVFFIGSIAVFSPLLRADLYASRITVNQNGNFTEEIAEVDFNALPLLDRESTGKLGDRVMGQMADLVSQFTVSELYTQINYQDNIVRVTPLEYIGIIKYFTNRSQGIPGYITVNSVTGDAKLVKLDKGMRYVPSAMFNEKLERKLRFQYPFEIFGTAQFELDEEGKPFYVVPTYTFRGLGMLRDIDGIIILDPVTGHSNKYSIAEIPTWVDHVFTAQLIIEQTDDWGLYREGFWNSMFGQKNVVQTTDGYNYLAMNDDVYVYTGITSVLEDAANLGFILSNMRTKETTFYAIAGAEEFSAMRSAEGQVQQMNYQASFPLLINLNGKPTYVLSLKDNAGLVKMYAFVDVVDYQKVVVTNAAEGIEKAAENYLGRKLEDIEVDKDKLTYVDIEIASITMATLSGNSYYYITSTDGSKYKVSLVVSDELPFVKVGDVLHAGYLDSTEVTELLDIE
ncbi:MAG: hypothetical protein PUF50_03525 [Erysipelotrichaceae bacterium]|nr:hypothetical protein [Erysipelotrichaceae bacterium]